MVVVHEMVLHERMNSDCYRFLSACFCQPQKNLLMEEMLLKNLTMNLQQINPVAALYSASMEESICEYSDEELAVEYAGLFLGPFEIKAPPYGSLYLDGEKRVMGDSTMEAIRLYEEAGLFRSEDCSELPDHIAVELEFMSYLIHKEAEALEKLDFSAARDWIKRQERFLGKFLRPWVVSLCGRIKESTDNRFYSALADCAAAFIKNARPGDVLPQELLKESERV